MTQTAIDAKGLGFQVGNAHLLKDITFQFQKGEHWIIYGMNGCGKTTLLSILAGYRKPTSGSLELFGEPVTEENVLELRKRVGFVSSSFFDARYRHERVMDIVLSGKFGTYGLDHGITSADFRRAKMLLNLLGLEDKHDQSYDRLSKGQRQNVLIARTFLQKPEILLLDEPCSGLDVMARARFMELLDRIMQETGLSVVFVSHELNEVKSRFENVLFLRNGRLFDQGSTKDLFTEERLSVFLQQKVQLNPVENVDLKPLRESQVYYDKIFSEA